MPAETLTLWSRFKAKNPRSENSANRAASSQQRGTIRNECFNFYLILGIKEYEPDCRKKLVGSDTGILYYILPFCNSRMQLWSLHTTPQSARLPLTSLYFLFLCKWDPFLSLFWMHCISSQIGRQFAPKSLSRDWHHYMKRGERL